MEEKREKRLSINEWCEDSRPRERLLKNGASALSNAELLAILIQSGTPQQDAVQLMNHVLLDCDNSLDKLGKMSFEQLTSYNGIGPAKAVTIMAACEFGRRRMKKDSQVYKRMDNSELVFQEILKPLFWDLSEEECYVVLFNQGLRLISTELIGRGGWTAVNVDLRKVIKTAIMKNATALILAHNHPSGSIRPGKADDDTTRNLKNACEIMNIKMLDHIVVGGEKYYSYAESGRL